MRLNKELFERLVLLTKQDKKTLIEKCLKTSEETGELASAALSCSGAHGTAYKGETLNDVLEESADVIICAFSAAIEAGFSIEDIESAMELKSLKWERVITKE